MERPCGEAAGVQAGLSYLGLEGMRCSQQVRQDNQEQETEYWVAVRQWHFAPGKQVRRAGFRRGRVPVGCGACERLGCRAQN